MNAFERTVVHLLVRVVAALEKIPEEWVLEPRRPSQHGGRVHPDIWEDD